MDIRGFGPWFPKPKLEKEKRRGGGLLACSRFRLSTTKGHGNEKKEKAKEAKTSRGGNDANDTHIPVPPSGMPIQPVLLKINEL